MEHNNNNNNNNINSPLPRIKVFFFLTQTMIFFSCVVWNSPFIHVTLFPIFALDMCVVLALCHGCTTTCKGAFQVRDTIKALQGMTAGCMWRPHKKFLYSLSLQQFQPALASHLYICVSEPRRRHLNHISPTLYLHGTWLCEVLWLTSVW